jgi:hypothetical protein
MKSNPHIESFDTERDGNVPASHPDEREATTRTQLEIAELKKIDAQRYTNRTLFRNRNSRKIESLLFHGKKSRTNVQRWKKPKAVQKRMKTEQNSPVGKAKEPESLACQAINETTPKSTNTQSR